VTAVAAPAAGGELAVEIALPPGIEGRFHLRPQGTAEGSALPVLVLGPAGSSATGEQATAIAGWPAALAPATGLPRPAAPGRGEPAGQGVVRQRAARRALLKALSARAGPEDPEDPDAGPEPELAAAAEALATTLATAWATAGPAGIATMLAEGSRLGEELAKVTPGALPPIIAAAEAAHQRCLERQENGCASGAQRLAGSLLELYAARAGDAASFAASAWTALGWQMLESYLFGSAERSLRRAIELDPRQVAAHLTLAILYERRAEYEAAADVLGRALVARPDLPEARLRRAIQWARLGRSADAARELAKLTSGSAPAWMRVIAFEELATLERQTSGADAAAATLRRAVTAFPREEQLRIQLAAVLEAAGETREAARLLGELGEAAAPGSPRNRYGDWPTEELERVRGSFRARAADQVSNLDRALEATR
jgi:Tfp pilus assembly protein PilF